MPRPKGGYTLKNGDVVPGTTTITGRFKDADPIVAWAFKQRRPPGRRLEDLLDRPDHLEQDLSGLRPRS